MGNSLAFQPDASLALGEIRLDVGADRPELRRFYIEDLPRGRIKIVQVDTGPLVDRMFGGEDQERVIELPRASVTELLPFLLSAALGTRSPLTIDDLETFCRARGLRYRRMSWPL